MEHSPIKLHDYYGPNSFKYREDDAKKYLGDAQIYVKGFKYEKDRI